MTRIRSKASAETPVEAAENSAAVERTPATEAEQTAPAEAQAETAAEPAAPADVVTVPVYDVSAPAGPRRRSGIAFGPAPLTLTEADLGPDIDATLKRLRDDPMLRVTVRLVEQPAG
ncbi:hypothetical protein GWI72_00830 [Microvirga tunisiensis]|uniref:Uncharacterized protein n=1 Tax=Pannonibacter tanglangensis TaxID=2750084 RepID=A0A7X5EZ52_9HYPH|nr:hypothetical protein [Pannonibacter sp. XCT-53]NBN76807.1 hypothetical protein [Pannonibacter sp. XCT-53]